VSAEATVSFRVLRCGLMLKPAAFLLGAIVFSGACSPPPDPTPALTPENAVALLNNSNKAKDWLAFTQKHDSSCQWRVTLPEQASHPTEIDADHVVYCRVTPNPRELDASAQFTFDKVEKRWMLTAFRS
jgi:hypothetical protein